MTDSQKNFFGENNLETSNKRFQIKNHVINNDNILLITNNIQYFQNKGCYVLWIGNEKIVYLKEWQVMPVYNFETIGYAYIVKLNRNYFKSYNCFKSDRFFFEKKKLLIHYLMSLNNKQVTTCGLKKVIVKRRLCNERKKSSSISCQ